MLRKRGHNNEYNHLSSSYHITIPYKHKNTFDKHSRVLTIDTTLNVKLKNINNIAY